MNPPSTEGSAAAQEAIYAALEALETALRADLCAFLTQDEGQGPQLYLGVPDLGAVDPNKAFALFTELREALSAGDEPAERAVAGYEAVLVPTATAAGRALLAVGRRKERPSSAERDAAVRFAGAMVRLLAAATPALQAPATRPRVVRIGIESSADRCGAEVSLDLGDEVGQGSAEDAVPLRAVANATLDAAGRWADGLKLVQMAEGDIAGVRAVLALITDEQGRSLLGSSLVEENADPLHAAARATLQALARSTD